MARTGDWLDRSKEESRLSPDFWSWLLGDRGAIYRDGSLGRARLRGKRGQMAWREKCSERASGQSRGPRTDPEAPAWD